QGCALLMDARGRGKRITGQQRANLSIDPRVADRTAGDRDAVHSGLLQHPKTRVGGEQVAAADHGSVADVLFDLFQKVPVAWSVVLLLDRSPMNGDRRSTETERPIDDLEEPRAAF